MWGLPEKNDATLRGGDAHQLLYVPEVLVHGTSCGVPLFLSTPQGQKGGNSDRKLFMWPLNMALIALQEAASASQLKYIPESRIGESS